MGSGSVYIIGGNEILRKISGVIDSGLSKDQIGLCQLKVGHRSDYT